MRRRTTLTLSLLFGFFASSCGSGDTAGDAATSEAVAATAEPLGCYIQRGTPAEARERPSPLRELRFSIGGHEALLCHGAPSARGREIMGGLVVYGQPERIGANEPTTLHLSGHASVGGVELDAGSYSLYAIPGPEEWVFFVNSNWERWGIPIDDAVRATEVGTFTAHPEPMAEYVETLDYHFEPMANNTMGDLVLEWENTRVRFHIHPGI